MPSIIRPEDFNKNTADPNRGRWTHAQMTALVEVLDGTEVIAELRLSTGHAWPVSLVRMGHREVLVRGSGMNAAGVWYRIDSIGVIVDLRTNSSAKWDAIQRHREMQR